MNWVSLAFFLLVGWMDLEIYKRHAAKRDPAAIARRPLQAVSPLTRLFGRIQDFCYLLVAAHLGLQAFALNPGGPSPSAFGLGACVSAGGLLLLHFSLGALGDQFSPCQSARIPTKRVRSGPYRHVSHPIYLANLLVLAGMAVADAGPGILAALALIASAYAFAIRDENRMLDRAFPVNRRRTE